jgi:hypothetical protein
MPIRGVFHTDDGRTMRLTLRASRCSAATKSEVTVAVRKEMKVIPNTITALPTRRPHVVVGTMSP